MDPLSITAGSLTIAKLCATCIVSLTTWVGEVRAIDGRIEAFCTEIRSLTQTLDALNSSLLLPEMLRAAQAADSTSEGELWRQLHISLDDCRTTMEQLREILDSLKKPLGRGLRLFRRPVSQFKESLEAGTIALLRERIIFFNTSLALPLQMMNLMIQLSQKEMNIKNHHQMIDKVDDLQKKLQKLAAALNVRSTSDISARSTTQEDKSIVDHMKSYVKTAETVVSRSSSSTTSSSSATVVAPGAESLSTNVSANFALSSAPGPQHSEYRRRIESWIPSTTPRTAGVQQVFNSEASASAQRTGSTQSTIEDFDLELELTLQYLQNGHKKYDAADWAGAEACYRKASVKLAANNFHDKIALRPEDLQLKVASACFKQRNWKDAQNLLKPLVVWKTAHDRATAFAANYLLAEVFLHVKDYQNAETYALTAIKGRKKCFGGKHPLYIQSVSLILAIYQAKGDEAEVEAWKAVLGTNESELVPYKSELAPYQPELPLQEPNLLPHIPQSLLPNPTAYKPKPLPQKPDWLLQKPQALPYESGTLPYEPGLLPYKLGLYGNFREVLSYNPTKNPTFTVENDNATPYLAITPATQDQWTYLESKPDSSTDANMSKGSETDHVQISYKNLPSPLHGGRRDTETTTQERDEAFTRAMRIAVEQVSDENDRPLQLSQWVRGTFQVLLSPLSVADLAIFTSTTSETVQKSLLPRVLEHDDTTLVSDATYMPPLFKGLLVASPDFPKNLPRHHVKLGQRCVDLMSNTLRENICSLPSTGSLISGVERENLLSLVPSWLRYACRYWAYHIHEGWARYPSTQGSTILRFFSTHLLHWLEIMGIMKRISDALAMIKLIKDDLVFHHSDNSELAAFVTDTERFVLRHGSILESAPLQVYSAALLFSPKESIVRNHFFSSVPAWIGNSPEIEEKWGSCLVSLGGTSRMNCMAFSPDQKILATGSLDKKVLLWDVGTGLLLHTLEGHLESVLVLAFSPKAPYVASGSKDKTVRIWESVTGHLRTVLEGHAASIMIIVFSSDGKLLVTASADRTLGVWHFETGRRCCKFEGHSMPINAISMTPDGHLVASGSDDCTVRLWDVESGQLWATLRGHTDTVTSVAFSPDAHILVSGSYDKNVRLWNLKTRAAFSLLEGHTKIVNCVVVSSDGKIVASAGDDDKVGLWNVRSGEHMAWLEAKGEPSYIKGLEFSDLSRLLVVFSGDSTIRIWNVASRTVMTTLKSYPSSLRCFAISSRGHLAATATNFQTAQLWDTHLGDSHTTVEGHQDPVLRIFFTPDGRFAVSCDTDDALRLWDVHTGKCLRALHSLPQNAKITGKTESSFTPDCSRLKVGSTLISTGLSLSPSTSPPPREAKSARYTVEAPAGDWVVEISTGTKVLWLPADRRPFAFKAHDNIIAIGHRWGGVTFLVLDPDVNPRP